MTRPTKWLNKLKSPETVPTRTRSAKTESRIAQDLKGRTTCNSGARFGENDVITDFCEVEAKTTAKDSFRVTSKDLNKASFKCKADKMPIMVIDFEVMQKKFVVLEYDDFMYLVNAANNG